MNRLVVTRSKRSFILREFARVDVLVSAMFFGTAQEIIEHVRHHKGAGAVIEWRIKP